MKVIYTTDLSRPGNDCYIYESVSIVEQFDIYSVITYSKVSGWCSGTDVNVEITTESYNEAMGVYRSLGGKVNK